MGLTLGLRLNRLKARIAEIACWRVRQRIDIKEWFADGVATELGARWPRRDGVVEFSATAILPDLWPLSESRLTLDLEGESLLSIVYPNGDAARFGLDPYHQEFPIAGRRFSISTESVARKPFGEPSTDPRINRAAMLWLDSPVDRLRLLLQQVFEAVDYLANHDVAPLMLDAAEDALQSLRWPSASADYVARIAMSPSHQKLWQLPDAKRDPESLGDAERESVVKACDNLAAALRGLQTRFPPQGELALTGHAHIDLAWLWPYRETRGKLRRTFHTALSLMEMSRDFRFSQSMAQFYAQVEEDDPRLFSKIVERVKAGAWEPIGGMWVEPDTNMPTGESLVRQILYGQRYFEQKFGKRHSVCWLPDTFGFSGALPQLLRQGGIENFFTIKVNWSETNRMPADLFWWEGLDGSRVLAHTFDNPMEGYNGFAHPRCFGATWSNYRGKNHHPVSLLSVGYGDGGGGVTAEMVERETQLRDFPVLPRARWSTVESFFENARAGVAAKEIPVWTGEIYLERHRGTLTTQSGVKRQHRMAERALITAETLASIAHLMGADAPRNLEPSWRALLKNEFHDILPGSSIREVYQDAEIELGDVLGTGLQVQEAALAAIVARLPTGDAGDVVVALNPSLAPRTLNATLPDGSVLATSDIVPPLGVGVFDRATLTSRAGLSCNSTHLENEFISATINPDGTLASLLHKASGREALDGRGNQLWAYPFDKPRQFDAWDIESDYAERGEELTAVDDIAVVERGPHVAAIRVRRRYRHSTIIQTLRLGANSRRLDIVTELDWHDRRVFLRSLTPAAVRARAATFECAYGVIERPTHRNTSWDEAMFEACAHRFVDLSEPGFGLAILNNAKYGHSVRDSMLGISLLRSPVYPDPYADEGPQKFTYALMPHSGEWREGGVREEAEDLNQPLVVALSRGLKPGHVAPIAIRGIDAALSTMKPAEDGHGLILRVYEPAGRRGDCEISLPDGWSNLGTVNLLEEPFERRHKVDLAPFEVRSWRLVPKSG